MESIVQVHFSLSKDKLFQSIIFSKGNHIGNFIVFSIVIVGVVFNVPYETAAIAGAGRPRGRQPFRHCLQNEALQCCSGCNYERQKEGEGKSQEREERKEGERRIRWKEMKRQRSSDSFLPKSTVSVISSSRGGHRTRLRRDTLPYRTRASAYSTHINFVTLTL